MYNITKNQRLNSQGQSVKVKIEQSRSIVPRSKFMFLVFVATYRLGVKLSIHIDRKMFALTIPFGI